MPSNTKPSSHPPHGTRRRQVSFVALALAVPLCFVLHSSMAIGNHRTLWGALDGAVFVLCLALVLVGGSRIRQAWLRAGLLGLVTGFFVVFFVGAGAHYRFFHDCVHYQMFLEWRQGPGVLWDIVRTQTWWDWTVAVAAPLLAVGLLSRRRGPIPLRLAVPAGVLLTGLLTAGWYVSARGQVHSPGGRNVFMLFVRRNAAAGVRSVSSRFYVHQEAERAGEIRSRFREYYPPPGAGYLADTLPDYPLLKVPDTPNDAAPLIPIGRQRPNIVLLVMESVRAYECGAYGAEPSFTPTLDRLAAEGLVFRNFYANGNVTAQAELALLCSFHPNVGRATIYSAAHKLKLRSLPDILRAEGYNPLWISGYTFPYSTQSRFLRLHGLNRMYDAGDMPADAARLGWRSGVADHVMLDWAADLLDRQPQPFFAEIMTLSNHWPFDWDYPTAGQTPVTSSDPAYAAYTRGVYYADWAVGRFMEQARTKPYFDNTIFIFCGDHGVWLFPPEQDLSPARKVEAYFRSPMVFYAPKLIEPRVCGTPGSQVDLAPTLLHMLGIRRRNSFVGASLLADSRTPRRVLLTHTTRWHVREGNRYLYDVEMDAPGQHTAGASGTHDGDRSGRHVLLVTDEDLLRTPDTGKTARGPERERLRLIRWARDLIFMNRYLVESDTIYTPPSSWQHQRTEPVSCP